MDIYAMQIDVNKLHSAIEFYDSKSILEINKCGIDHQPKYIFIIGSRKDFYVRVKIVNNLTVHHVTGVIVSHT